MNSPARTLDVDPSDLRAVARRVRDDILQANCVARVQTLQQEIHVRCLSDTCDKVLSDDSNDGWLKEDWSDW